MRDGGWLVREDIRRWRGQVGAKPPDRIGDKAKVRRWRVGAQPLGNGGREEYIIGRAEITEHSVPHCEEWETTTQFSITPSGQVNFLKVTDNREDGWMKKEILEKTESWTGDMSDTKRANYKVEFLMEDGDSCVGNKEVNAWLKEYAPEPALELPRNITF